MIREGGGWGMRFHEEVQGVKRTGRQEGEA